MRRLESERKKRGLSQAMLARTADMHPTTVGQIESGYIGKPYTGQLAKLAAALDWPADDAASLLEDVSEHA